MIIMSKKLKIKYTGEDKYKPKNIKRDVFMAVIGTESKTRERTFDGKTRTVSDVSFMVIGDNGQPALLHEMNSQIMVDENAELEGGRLVQMVNNLLTLMKVWSEKNSTDGTGSGN